MTQRDGGVGSLQASFDTVLVRGRGIICIDNLRGKFDCAGLESFLAEPVYLARVPHMASMEIETKNIVTMLTTNKAEATPDLMNRSSIVRILRQVDGYQFRQSPEGDILEHINQNQRKYLGAVLAVVRAWDTAGRPKTQETRHDFRPWAQTLDWIVQGIFKLPPLLDGHRSAQVRASNPHLSWLRDVVLAIRQAKQLNRRLRVSEITIILNEQSVEIPGVKPHEDIEDDGVAKRAFQQVGKRLSRCFKLSGDGPPDDPLIVDGWKVVRTPFTDSKGHETYEYAVFSSDTP
ncbi:MAG: hypothetical protein R3E01_22465 [Pirellulaceae bacterium]